MGVAMKIKITRSKKRSKTVSARQDGDTIEILAPAHLSDEELQPIIAHLTGRIERRAQKEALDDANLHAIASELNHRYFQNALHWASITWSMQQNKRFGSCTPIDSTIRISHRLAHMPRFVQEYVVMHELAHLLEANHGPRFWSIVEQYPLTERARGYLMAVGLEQLDDEA